MDKKLLTISQAAKFLGVSIDTLRRWDKAGSLRSTRVSARGHRYYRQEDLHRFSDDIFALAKKWILADQAALPAPEFYCADSQSFQSRLNKLGKQLASIADFKNDFSLIISVAGEIGNNSFDHNFGSWPDIRGIFFAFDLNKRKIVLADRGQGLLKTLKKVKPELMDEMAALQTAFTEALSGRSPEKRGNGLKYVRKVVTEIKKSVPLSLYFQSGAASLSLKEGDWPLAIMETKDSFHGCLVLIGF